MALSGLGSDKPEHRAAQVFGGSGTRSCRFDPSQILDGPGGTSDTDRREQRCLNFTERNSERLDDVAAFHGLDLDSLQQRRHSRKDMSMVYDIGPYRAFMGFFS